MDFNLKIGAVVNKTEVGQQVKKALNELEHTDVTKLKITIDGKEFIKQIDTYVNKSGELVKTEKILIETTNQLGKAFENVTGVAKGKFGAESIVTELKSAYDHTKTLSKEVQKYIDQQGRSVLKTTEMNESGQRYIKTITTETTALGDLRKVTEITDEQGNKLAKDFEEIQRVTEVTDKSMHKFTDELGRTVTQIRELDNKGITRIKEIVESTNEFGVKTKETSKYIENSNGKLIKLGNTYKEVTNDEIAYQQQQEKLKQTTEEVAESTEKQNKAQGNILETFGKVLKFQMVTKIITGFTTACREAIETVKDFDSALTEFKKVSDLSGEALDNYAKKLGDLGESVARTRTEMVEASTEFKKSGYSDADSAQLAQLAQLYSNIADEEITAGESASFLISQMKAFGYTADEAIHILDGINEVSNNYAVSSADLANNLGKVSATLHANNVSYEESLGMLTAITEITRNASTGARGLRILF